MPYGIDEKLMAGNRAITTIIDTKGDIDSLLKPGMLTYTSDDSSMYLTTPRSKDFGEYKRVIFEDADGKVSNNLVFKGAVLFENGIDIKGSATTVETVNMVINDNIIELNAVDTGNGITLNTAGVQIHRGTKGTANILFSESANGWLLDTDGSVKHTFGTDGTYTALTGVVAPNLSVSSAATLNGTLSIGAAATVTGTLTVPTPTISMHASTKKYVDDNITTVNTSITTTNTNLTALRIFSSLAVSGQTTLTPTNNNTALTFITGNGITLTTDNTAKTLYIDAHLGNSLFSDASGIKVVDNTSNQKIRVMASGYLSGTRRAINFIPSGGTSISTADNTGQDRVDITIGTPTQWDWTNAITGKPTTVAEYGITNAMTTAHPANAISGFGTTGTSTYVSRIDHTHALTVDGDMTGSVTLNNIADTMSITLKDVLAVPSTYRSVTVNSKGLVTAGSNPTTIAGYGLTDAVSKAGDTMTGALIINSGAQALTIKPGAVDHAYISINARTATPDARSGWIGYGSGATTTLSISNEIASGDINFVTSGSIKANNNIIWNQSNLTKLSQLTNDIGFVTGNQNVTVTGDVTGSGTTALNLTLADSGVTAGTYPKVKVDAKGRVTNGYSLASTDIPNLDWSKITTGKPTTLAGYGITDALNSSYIPLWTSVSGKPVFATVATTGSYNDLINKPAAVTPPIFSTTVDGFVPKSVSTAGKFLRDDATWQTVVTSPTWASITGTPTTLAGYGITDAVSSPGVIGDVTKDLNVASLLRWKNYGNGHVIFDASKGTSPTGTVVDSSNAAVEWIPTYPTLMGWNGTTTFGVRVDKARVADTAVSANNLSNGNGINIYDDGGDLKIEGLGSTNSITMETSTFTARAAAITMETQGDFLLSDGVGSTYSIYSELNLKTFSAAVDGLVPKTITAPSNRFLRDDGTWQTISGGVTSVAGKTGAVTLTSTDVGLGTWHKDINPPSGTTQLNYDGYLYATRVFNAVYNDYAEYYLKDEYLEAGDIVAKNPNGKGYIKSTDAYDNLVVGIFSDEYGQCLGGNGDGKDDETFAPVGQAGRLKVKVTGNVKLGDLIVASSIPGVGMSSTSYIPGTVVGKALECHTGEKVDRIQVQIMTI